MQHEAKSRPVPSREAAPRAPYLAPTLRRFGHLADVTRASDRVGLLDGAMGVSMNRT